jgi:hypothetical protein
MQPSGVHVFKLNNNAKSNKGLKQFSRPGISPALAPEGAEPAAKKQKAAEEPPAPPPPRATPYVFEEKPEPEDPQEKRRLAMKIIQYKQSFPTKFQSLVIQDLHQKSVPELKEMLADCQYMLAAGTNSTLYRLGFNFGVTAIERLANATGAKCQGLSVYLQRDEEWRDLCKEMELQYSEFTPIGVEKRMLFKLIQAAGAVDERNRYESYTQPEDTRRVKPSVLETYKNL